MRVLLFNDSVSRRNRGRLSDHDLVERITLLRHNLYRPSIVTFVSQDLLQPDHKGLQLVGIIRSVVDVPADLPDSLIDATIRFLHI
jgi:hypothetical protein